VLALLAAPPPAVQEIGTGAEESSPALLVDRVPDIRGGLARDLADGAASVAAGPGRGGADSGGGPHVPPGFRARIAVEVDVRDGEGSHGSAPSAIMST